MLNFTIFKQGTRNSTAGCIYLSNFETMILCVSMAGDVWHRGASYWLKPCYVNLVRLLPGEALPERRVSQSGSLKPYNPKWMWHQSEMFFLWFRVEYRWRSLFDSIRNRPQWFSYSFKSYVYIHSHTNIHNRIRLDNTKLNLGVVHFWVIFIRIYPRILYNNNWSQCPAK